MDDIKKALHDAGWSDELIRSFVGRNCKQTPFPSARIGRNTGTINRSSLLYSKNKEIGSPDAIYRTE